ncbi:hypothetical protein CRUP_028179, partial [Coryphaenoides rupestris]
DLGSVPDRNFHLGFSYSGTCAIVVSARLYYRRCPGLVVGLTRFAVAVAGSEEAQQGSCVDGATATFPPEAHCLNDGVWGQLDGECVCDPGHEKVACRRGYYKAANESGGCRPCPPNSGTKREGAEQCDCVDGFDRLPSDPQHQGCTRQPSSPVNLLVHHHNDSLLVVRWEPPSDLGGRAAWEVTYSVACFQKEVGGRQWEPCQEDVVFSPSSAGLTGTEVNVTGLRGHHDYRLSVRAANLLFGRQGGGSSAEATLNVHGRKVQVIVTVAPAPASNISEPLSVGEGIASPVEESFYQTGVWWIAAGLLGSVLLLTLVLTAGAERELELVPWNPSMTFCHLEVPPQSMILREHDHPLLANLRDTLVDRSRLTLGKELGKGEFGSVYEAVLAPEEEGVDSVKVAVKTIRGIHSQQDLHELIREAALMKSFDHDNVVWLWRDRRTLPPPCPW